MLVLDTISTQPCALVKVEYLRLDMVRGSQMPSHTDASACDTSWSVWPSS